ISQNAYDALAPFQWPLPAAREIPGQNGSGQHRFFQDGKFYTPDRKARFIAVEFRPAQVQPDRDYPLVLNTGRVRDHWHTMTRTGKTGRLSSHLAEPYVEMNPATALDLHFSDADLVRLTSRSGTAVMRLVITDRVQRGDIFAPMHWTERFSSEGRVDALVGAAHDPLSGQQESKFTPVRAESLSPDWFGFGVFRDEPSLEQLSELAYWCLARTVGGWRLEYAGFGACSAQVESLLGPAPDSYLSLPGGGIRAAIFQEDHLSAAIIVSTSGPVEADRTYLASLLPAALDSDTRANLLAGRSAQGKSAGPIVCSCEGVGRYTLIEAIDGGAMSVSALGACTKAGTNCGSCQPELKKLISEHKIKHATCVNEEAV
ncbi:MAG: molybdopterin dinucleotide binding domain-containing protein, partial [Pseudomonadota bacterium]